MKNSNHNLSPLAITLTEVFESMDKTAPIGTDMIIGDIHFTPSTLAEIISYKEYVEGCDVDLIEELEGMLPRPYYEMDALFSETLSMNDQSAIVDYLVANNFKGTITKDYQSIEEELDEETERTLLLAPVCFEDMVLIHACAKALGLTDPI